MRKFLITLIMCIVAGPGYCEGWFMGQKPKGIGVVNHKKVWNTFQTYFCKPQMESARDAATLELANGKYLICGHKGTDGCNDGVVVYSDREEVFYECDSSGRNKWKKIDKSELVHVDGVEMSKKAYADYDAGGDLQQDSWLYGTFRRCYGNNICYMVVAPSDHIVFNFGIMDNYSAGVDLCIKSGGEFDYDKYACICDSVKGFEPKFRGICTCKDEDSFFYDFSAKRCVLKGSKVEDKPAEQNVENQPAKQETIEEPVEEVVDNKTGTKTTVKYNYQQCEKDNDCKNIDNTVRPYLHSTAWHCAWQSAGVRVCTATACESGWTPINGYCQENKNTQTPQSENKNANSVSNIKTETKAGTKKPCTDLDNMDSNCRCIVAGTVERGGKCVCRDDNQEIKNGKCEWTAKYVAGLESDLDSKFNSLTATIGGFEKNVWRDENGEFNTARLASDSIAGVVLGTVGGIVTANLVKKAQVKQGFEDIGCYIGGQSVAGFGDEFNVGR